MTLTPSAWLPSMIADQSKTKHFLVIVGGVVALSLLAQIALPLGFTPVPLTGQTFGVYLIALLCGRKLGGAIVASYLAVGFVGLPVFAGAASGLSFGPTLGYLVGMLVASQAVGYLADRGWTKSFGRAWLAAVAGSVCVFTMGLAVLSAFVPADALLISGFLPFLPGDLIKTTLAASIATTIARR